MDLWWKIAGYARIRITSADQTASLRHLSDKLRLEDIHWLSDLSLETSVARWELNKVAGIIEKNGGKLEVIGYFGFLEKLKLCGKHPLLLAALLLLYVATTFIPSRIFFIQVEGNEQIPSRLILETAEQCGVYFGASSSELRSEQVKNLLLESLPELSWVGVNTNGCVATITVRERDVASEESKPSYGSIVAVRDAVITKITAENGTALCTVGQAVSKGQILISGYTDLGICTRVEAASGEVYGLTRRECDAVITENTLFRTEDTGQITRYSVIFGKNRINLYSNSGILDTTCGKMRMVYQLSLPGGWELPVYLVVETYETGQLAEGPREESSAEELLNESVLRQTKAAMIAGEVLRSDLELSCVNGVYRLAGLCQCRELIGRQASGVYYEGDGN